MTRIESPLSLRRMHVTSHAGVATAWHGGATGAVGSHGAAWRDADGARRARQRIRVRAPLRVAPRPPVAPRAGPGRAAFPRHTGSSSWARGTPAGSAARPPCSIRWRDAGLGQASCAPRSRPARRVTRPWPPRERAKPCGRCGGRAAARHQCAQRPARSGWGFGAHWYGRGILGGTGPAGPGPGKASS
jgi:hypothetical protein